MVLLRQRLLGALAELAQARDLGRKLFEVALEHPRDRLESGHVREQRAPEPHLERVDASRSFELFVRREDAVIGHLAEVATEHGAVRALEVGDRLCRFLLDLFEVLGARLFSRFDSLLFDPRRSDLVFGRGGGRRGSDLRGGRRCLALALDGGSSFGQPGLGYGRGLSDLLYASRRLSRGHFHRHVLLCAINAG